MPAYLLYHGNPNIIVHHKGTLHTDRYGLDTAVAVWKCKMDNFYSGPNLGSTHPVWSYLVMEKREVAIDAGFAMITGEYVGIAGGRTASIFECSYGTSDERIETHPDFISQIGGKPSDPLNGAIFLDPTTRRVTKNDGVGKSEFSGFSTVTGGEFAGIEAYLSVQITVRETWIATSRLSGIGVGKIGSPPIALAITGNWLLTGAGFQQRGNVYQNSYEWRASGPRLWNNVIYG